MKQKTKNYLTAEQLQGFSGILSDIIIRLEMTNNAIESLGFIQLKDKVAFNSLAGKLLSTTYEQNQRINKLLNEISFKLLVCDEKDEVNS